MIKFLVSFAVAFLFSCGLLASGMTDPQRVLGFLDIAGAWNPALAWVMGGAVVSAWPFFRWAHRRRQSLLGNALQWPETRRIDRRLLIGAAVFGLGWGMTGLCPAPALTLIVSGAPYILIFILSMAVGMRLVRAWELRRSAP